MDAIEIINSIRNREGQHPQNIKDCDSMSFFFSYRIKANQKTDFRNADSIQSGSCKSLVILR